MSDNFSIITTKPKTATIAIHLLHGKNLAAWVKSQPASTKHWLEANSFKGDSGTYCLLPDKNGNIESVACGVNEALDVWSIAHLVTALPAKTYHLEGKYTAEQATQLALGWALASYKFTKYKTPSPALPRSAGEGAGNPLSPQGGGLGRGPVLLAPKGCDVDYVRSMSGSVFWARDLINTPANDMDPQALAGEASAWAKKHKANVTVIKGEALLKENYPMVYTVGKAATVPPHLVDIKFARKGAPKITLVGKGVCFDSGGLDIKSTGNMKMMKKDMGGAACVLALAKTIIEMKLKVQLRVILPIVENAIAGNAMRPLDIVPTRKGITVEIGNTDAEGRLILCDALFEADSETPDLLIDCATLTGAARAALGTEIPAFFTNDDKLANELAATSVHQSDPLWRLPLWKNYRKQLDTANADLSNDPDSAYGGAITAALYLQEFVSKTPAWLHIDMMAWNVSNRPGRPQGGEAMAIRTLYALLRKRYGTD